MRTSGWWSTAANARGQKAAPIVKHMQPTVQKKKYDAELPKLRPPISPPHYYKKNLPIQDWSGFNKNWQQKK